MPHLREKIDFTVEVFIIYQNKVLLRKHDKYGIWLGVGGHIEADEDSNQAAIREIKEEVGLNAQLIGEAHIWKDGEKEIVAPAYLNRHSISDIHEHIAMIYFARVGNDQISQGETEKSEDIRWFSAEELNNPDFEIKESIKFYAKKALEKSLSQS